MNSAEIAALANVSRATVSRVLNGHTNVSEETKQKILKVMEEHNYFPDVSARNLAGKSNRFIGLFLVDFSSSKGEYTVTRSPFFFEFVAYAIDLANMYGYNLVTTVIHRDNLHDIDRLFQSRSIAGGILMGDILEQSTLANLVSQEYKLVLCHQIRRSPSPNILVANLDNFACGQLAGEELIRNGHTKIAHVTGESNRVAVQDRMDGFISALTSAGLSFDNKYLEYGAFYRQNSDYDATMRLLERNHDDLPTALFVPTAMMQIGALNAIRDFGLRVPEDISFIAVDDAGMESYTNPPLSVVKVSCENYANLAVSNLVNLIENGPGETSNFTLSGFDVIRRGSILPL